LKARWSRSVKRISISRFGTCDRYVLPPILAWRCTLNSDWSRVLSCNFRSQQCKILLLCLFTHWVNFVKSSFNIVVLVVSLPLLPPRGTARACLLNTLVMMKSTSVCDSVSHTRECLLCLPIIPYISPLNNSVPVGQYYLVNMHVPLDTFSILAWYHALSLPTILSGNDVQRTVSSTFLHIDDVIPWLSLLHSLTCCATLLVINVVIVFVTITAYMNHDELR
jgi:hypothetical protein